MIPPPHLAALRRLLSVAGPRSRALRTGDAAAAGVDAATLLDLHHADLVYLSRSSDRRAVTAEDMAAAPRICGVRLEHVQVLPRAVRAVEEAAPCPR